MMSWSCAGGGLNKLKWLLAWPLSLLLFFTVPNCATPRWERWYMVSFISSTLWIAFFSYIMVWMVRLAAQVILKCINYFLETFIDMLTLSSQVTVIGYTMGIPDVIMGITFLAAGTSVPDCLASLIVARQGRNKWFFFSCFSIIIDYHVEDEFADFQPAFYCYNISSRVIL